MSKINFYIGSALLLASCTSISNSFTTTLPIKHEVKEAGLYEAKPFTDANLFTVNIEGPAVRNDSLFVVNYLRDGTIAYVDSAGQCREYLSLPKGSTGNALRFDASGNMYVADFTGHNVLLVNPNKQVSVFCHNEAFNQPNDICLSRRYGYLLASDPRWKDSTGQLWRIETDGKPVLLEANMGTTNGICLSPDEKTLYVNESVQRKVWAFDIDTMGNVFNKRVFAEFEDYGLDGMHCDRKGNLFICRYGKGVVAIFSPKGELIREVPLSGKNCSNLTFGGKDGRTVFVTLQDRKGMDQFRTEFPGKDWIPPATKAAAPAATAGH